MQRWKNEYNRVTISFIIIIILKTMVVIMIMLVEITMIIKLLLLTGMMMITITVIIVKKILLITDSRRGYPLKVEDDRLPSTGPFFSYSFSLPRTPQGGLDLLVSPSAFLFSSILLVLASLGFCVPSWIWGFRFPQLGWE